MSGWPSFETPQQAEIAPSAGTALAGDAAPVVAPHPPAKLPSPRLKLETVRDVRRELARIYREARRGELKPETATKLAFLLDLTARMIERNELEARIEALEARGAR